MLRLGHLDECFAFFPKTVNTMKSIYFTILLENFLSYLTVGEYICLKDLYQNSDIKWSIISRVFEEDDWKMMDLIIFDPIVEYLEKKNKIVSAADNLIVLYEGVQFLD